MKASGIKFIDYPTYKGEDGELHRAKTWVGSFVGDLGDSADILEAEVVYALQFKYHANPETFEKSIVLAISGTPKKELL